MGSLVATLGRARIAYPGGCDIGLRPVDIHIRALKELNIKIDEQSGYINCATDGIVGADVGLDKISVGATENIMMAAVLGKGTTIIRNAAKEPVPSDLWDSIDKALDNSGNRKTIPLWRWMAAACVAAVAIATWMVMGNSPDEPDMIADNSVRTYATQPSEHRANTDTENQHAQSPSSDKTPSYNNEKLVAQTNARHDENDYSHGMQADTNVEGSMDHNGSKPTDNNSMRNEDYENKQKPALEKPLERSQGELLIEELEEKFAKDKKGYRKAKSGIKLFAQNSFHTFSL